MQTNFTNNTRGGETEINNGKTKMKHSLSKLFRNKYSLISCRSGAKISTTSQKIIILSNAFCI